jgi:hypothetical protein
MGAPVLKRLLIALIAVAFIGANLPSSCMDESSMHGASAMAQMDEPCSDCWGDARTIDFAKFAKMGCGALACAGIFGLPVRQIIALPDAAKPMQPSRVVDTMAGISLKPDPFPPRRTGRA